jgi:hypothetical protein
MGKEQADAEQNGAGNLNRPLLPPSKRVKGLIVTVAVSLFQREQHVNNIQNRNKRWASQFIIECQAWSEVLINTVCGCGEQKRIVIDDGHNQLQLVTWEYYNILQRTQMRLNLSARQTTK